MGATNMSEHAVVVYVNDAGRTFTATARKESARLPEVTDWCERHGFRSLTAAQNLSKDEAKQLKSALIAAYKTLSYRYVTRPAL